jgi:hypothetical protein
MMNPELPDTRTLTVVLPEAEWRALRAEEPDAVAWLHAQIRKRLDGQSQTPAAPPETDSWDDY